MKISHSSHSAFFRFGQLVLSWRFLRVAAVAYGLSALLLWATLGTLFVRGAGQAPGQSIGPDFAAFYTAGTMVRQGEKTRLYNFERQQQLQQQLHLTQHEDEVSAFINPAHYALLMAPLSTLAPRQAYAVFAATMFGCFVAGLVLLRRILPVLQTSPGNVLLLLALISPAVYFSISAGQNTGFSFLLHCAILFALIQRQDIWAGVLCGLGLLKPHLFLPLIPLLALGRRTGAIAGFLFTAGATLVLNVAVFGSDVFSRNAAALQTPLYNTAEITQSARMFSWLAFWRLLLGQGVAASVLGWLCAFAVFALLCVLWKRLTQTETSSRSTIPASAVSTVHSNALLENDLAVLYAITICGVITIVPHLPLYDLGLLILPALVFTNRVLDFPINRFVALRLLLLGLVMLVAVGDAVAR
ncbi:MAG TPA: glycosyltransferase family 87 protein, partial [Abditibacteriaceae bacterium]|nr:glycosyltransferase family 87 protein [Abditibacteriaceae bacterium]